MSTSYAETYLNAGWNPFPLPPGEKKNPPVGVTGGKRKPVTAAQVARWDWSGNAGLAMPDDIIGIDVDNYRDKHGLRSLRDAEAEWGKLPATWISSSKDHGRSGIRFYRVPADTDWSTVAATLGAARADAPDVDIIRPSHRYAVVHPSIHPSGDPYQWRTPAGEVGGYELAPRIEDLPELPQQWYAGLTTRAYGITRSTSRVAHSQEVTTALNWFDSLGSYSEQVTRAAEAALKSQEKPATTHHDHLVSDTLKLVGLGTNGHAGVRAALVALAAAFTRHADRSPETAEQETADVLAWAVGQVWVAREELVERSAQTPVNATDLDLSDVFVARYHDRVKYAVQRQDWMRYDAGRWVSDGDIKPEIDELVRSVWAYSVKTDKTGGEQLVDRTDWLREAARHSGIHTCAAGQQAARVDVNRFDDNRALFNLINGTVNLVTGEVYPQDPADLITSIAGTSYDANATCPTWDQFIIEVLPDAEVRGFVQRLFGSALLGDVRDHVLPVFTGNGRNGKGVCVRTIAKVFGEYSTTINKDLLRESVFGANPDYAKASLAGKRLVVGSELTAGDTWDVAQVKELTGGDELQARFPYGREFTFTPSHTLVIMSNHKPATGDGEPAFWARYREVPFTQSFEGREDVTLEQRIGDELPGVLNWLLAGLNRYLSDGLGYPEAIRDAVNATRLQEEPRLQAVLDFRGTDEGGIEYRYEVTGNRDDSVPVSELLPVWKSWVADHNQGVGIKERVSLGNDNHFGQSLSATSGRLEALTGNEARVKEGNKWVKRPRVTGLRKRSVTDGSDLVTDDPQPIGHSGNSSDQRLHKIMTDVTDVTDESETKFPQRDFSTSTGNFSTEIKFPGSSVTSVMAGQSVAPSVMASVTDDATIGHSETSSDPEVTTQGDTLVSGVASPARGERELVYREPMSEVEFTDWWKSEQVSSPTYVVAGTS